MSESLYARQVGGDLGQVLCELGAAEGVSITYRRWLPGDTTPEPCPHDSLSGDEGPIAELGRMPIWWRCDSCDALVLDMGVRAPQCDCLDTSVAYHWWDCPLTPIWAETIRAGYVPWMAIDS